MLVCFSLVQTISALFDVVTSSITCNRVQAFNLSRFRSSFVGRNSEQQTYARCTTLNAV